MSGNIDLQDFNAGTVDPEKAPTPQRRKSVESESSPEESSSDEQSSPNDKINLLMEDIDPEKVIYDLKELKPFRKHLFYCKRDYIRYQIRANPNWSF